jgi:hypothetical protein
MKPSQTTTFFERFASPGERSPITILKVERLGQRSHALSQESGQTAADPPTSFPYLKRELWGMGLAQLLEPLWSAHTTP